VLGASAVAFALPLVLVTGAVVVLAVVAAASPSRRQRDLLAILDRLIVLATVLRWQRRR
jgi:hypothetical protein